MFICILPYFFAKVATIWEKAKLSLVKILLIIYFILFNTPLIA